MVGAPSITLAPRKTPYLNPSWLGARLGGDSFCDLALYYRANYLQPPTQNMFDGNAYRAKHRQQVGRDTQFLEKLGYTVFVEDQNEYTIKTSAGISITAKPDIVGRHADGSFIVLDSKTGQPSGKHVGQLMYYQFTLPIAKLHGIEETPEGMLSYPDHQLELPSYGVTETVVEDLRMVLEIVSSSTRPDATPSKRECQWCPFAQVCEHRATESPTGFLEI